MIINFLGIEVNVLALITFIFTTLLITELLKKLVYFLMSKIIKTKDNLKLINKSQLIPLCLSWIVGTIIFILIEVITIKDMITYDTIIQFALMTALLNGGYKLLKPIINKWFKSKGV